MTAAPEVQLDFLGLFVSRILLTLCYMLMVFQVMAFTLLFEKMSVDVYLDSNTF